MNKQIFDPAKLRVVGRLAWMKDADEGHWFSVPNSNDQLIFSEEETYAHSLSGTKIEVVQITNRRGGPEVVPFSAAYEGYPSFSTMVENGLGIFEALADAGVELWSTDPDVIFQWHKQHVVLCEPVNGGDRWDPYNWEDIGFVVVSRLELQRRLKNFAEQLRSKKAAWDSQNRAARDSAHAVQVSERATKTKIRSSPEYQALFSAFIGLAESEIVWTYKNDGSNSYLVPRCNVPYHVIASAHVLVEFRLKVGRFAEQKVA